MRKTTEQKAKDLAEQTLKLKRKIACERKPELLDALAIARALRNYMYDLTGEEPVLQAAVDRLEGFVDLAAKAVTL